jgi:hypothetical protein
MLLVEKERFHRRDDDEFVDVTVACDENSQIQETF